jgi:HK97 gp10 family phage protein
MARVTATVEGADELIAALKQMRVDVDGLLAVAAQAGAQVIADAANPLAPRPVIDTEVAEQGKGRATVDVGFPKEKWFYKFFETGTKPHYIPGPLTLKFDDGEVHVVGGANHPGMAARPFLRPAFDAQAGAGANSPAAQATGDVIRKKALKA